MAKDLIIVESPNKVKKILEFVGSNYIVASSIGHVRDLSNRGKFGLGIIDWETLDVAYKDIPEKKAIIEELKGYVKKCKYVYLAMDPDREGEAIAWHLIKALEIPKNKVKRITFNEITAPVVKSALKKARDIDMDLVKAQEARRLLDRIVGYRLSRLVKAKAKAKSAGRVQSVALKIIVDRERQRKEFIPTYWYLLEVLYDENNTFNYANEKFIIQKFDSKNLVKQILSELSETFKVVDIKIGKSKIEKPIPFEMATFLQGMFNSYSASNKLASFALQSLYEKGLITYPRTDSTRISSKEFLNEVKTWVKSKYGASLYEELKHKSSGKKRKVTEQDAHEAIRPTHVTLTPSEAKTKHKLKDFEMKAYTLIWNTTVQAFMINGENETFKYMLQNKKHNFVFSNSKPSVLGFRVVNYEKKEGFLEFKINEEIKVSKEKFIAKEHSTKPPARYTQASLIKKLKEEGIGRPSTYAPTTQTLFDRLYVAGEGSAMEPTDLGFVVSDKLQSEFYDLISESYTSQMEAALDEIAHGTVDYKEYIKTFYDGFEQRISNALETMEITVTLPKFVGEKCPKCGGELVERYSPKTKKTFAGCYNFPKCRYIKGSEKLPKTIELKELCPECGNKLLLRFTSRRQQFFVGCSNFPKCRHIRKFKKNDLQYVEKKFIKLAETQLLKKKSTKKKQVKKTSKKTKK